MDQIIVAALGHTSKRIAKNDGGRSGDESSKYLEQLITLIQVIKKLAKSFLVITPEIFKPKVYLVTKGNFDKSKKKLK